jgi:hypothetical protein
MNPTPIATPVCRTAAVSTAWSRRLRWTARWSRSGNSRRTSWASSDLVKFGAFTEEMAPICRPPCQRRLNIIVSGGTGSGKTTTLNALSSFIDNHERVLTIEDTAELQLQQVHVGRMESRPANVEGKGAVTQRDCLRNALRMRPDRIIVGETRGEEVIDMLQAMNTGHDGSMTTIHANNARDGDQPSGKHGRHGRDRDAAEGRARPDRLGCEPDRAGQPSAGRLAPHDLDHRNHRDGRRSHLDAGNLPLRTPGGRAFGQDHRPLQRHRHPLAYSDRFRQWGYDLPASIYEPIVRAMMIQPTIIIYILIFVAVWCWSKASIWWSSANHQPQQSAEPPPDAAGKERQPRSRSWNNSARKCQPAPQGKGNIPLYSILAKKAQKANIAFSPKALIAIMGLLAVVAFLGLTIVHPATPVRMALAIGMGVGRGLCLGQQEGQEAHGRLMEEQLPDAVELMVRSLRVGHPFSPPPSASSRKRSPIRWAPNSA